MRTSQRCSRMRIRRRRRSQKAGSQRSSISYSCDSHLTVERPLWARLLFVVFGVHAHVEFVLAESAAQQSERQEEPHGSASGGHDRDKLVTSCFRVACFYYSCNTLVSTVSQLVCSRSAALSEVGGRRPCSSVMTDGLLAGRHLEFCQPLFTWRITS